MHISDFFCTFARNFAQKGEMDKALRDKFISIISRAIETKHGDVELITKPEILSIKLTAGCRLQCAFHYMIRFQVDSEVRLLYFEFLDSQWMIDKNVCKWWVFAVGQLPKNAHVCLVTDKGFDADAFELVRLANAQSLHDRLILAKYCGDEEQVLMLNRLSTDYSDPRGRTGLLTTSRPCSGAVFYQYESSFSTIGILEMLCIPIKNEFTFKCPYIENEVIEDKALKVLNDLQITETQLLSEEDFLLSITKDQKLKLVTVEMGSEFCGEYSHTEMKIYLNESLYFTNPARARFTLAHELGHHFLHKHILEQQSYRALDDDSSIELVGVDNDQVRYFESQANKFASYLLMPGAMVQQFARVVFKELGIREDYVYSDDQFFAGEGCVNRENAKKVVERVAKHFKVSKEVARLRLKSLDMLREEESIGALNIYL